MAARITRRREIGKRRAVAPPFATILTFNSIICPSSRVRPSDSGAEVVESVEGAEGAGGIGGVLDLGVSVAAAAATGCGSARDAMSVMHSCSSAERASKYVLHCEIQVHVGSGWW